MRYNDPTRSYQSTKQPAIAVTIVTSSMMWNHTADVNLEIHVYLSLLTNQKWEYRKTPNISRTLVGNKIVDNSDVVGASPVGAAPTTSSFST